MKHLWMVAALTFGTAATLGAQDGPRTDSRAELEARRDSLGQVLVMLDAGDERSEDVERRIATIEQRLRIGDFRAGDMVSLSVRGQEQYTGNFPVQPDQTLELPGIDPVPLGGALYSEASEVIRGALATVLRNPVVELTYQMRLAVTGQVARPGFYDVRGTLLLSDVLSEAGGPTQNALLEDIEVRRGGKTIMSGEELVTAGFTLDDLGLRSGDVIQIPQDRGTFYSLRNVSILLGTIFSVIALIRVF